VVSLELLTDTVLPMALESTRPLTSAGA